MSAKSELTYRQQQKRNTEQFQSLTPDQQKQIRDNGYNNRGWSNVKQSWVLLCNEKEAESDRIYKFRVKAISQQSHGDQENMPLLESFQRSRQAIRELKTVFLEATEL